MEKENKLIKKVKSKWKTYSSHAAIAILFLPIGMSLTEIETIKQILVNTISGLILLLPWFILIYIAIKMISNSIKNLVKKIPEWMDDWERRKIRIMRVERAVGNR